MDKSKLAIFISSTLFIYSACTFSATQSISGEGQLAEVNENSLISDWTVSDSATLIVGNGASTGTVWVEGANLTTTGTGITMGTIGIAAGSNVSLSNITIAPDDTRGLYLSLWSTDTEGSFVSVSDSSISGTTSGVNIVGALNTVELNNTQANGRRGVTSSGGTINILNGSIITGTETGILIRVDSLFNTTANVVVDNATVTGQSGSAITVKDYGSGYHTIANITLRNGTTLISGDDNIVTVSDTAEARLTVDNSSLVGNISNGTQSTADVILSNNSSLTGTLNNVTSMMLDNTSLLTLTGDSSVGELNNAGNIALSSDNASVGTVLTVNGNYTGLEGSAILMRVALAGDDSLTDRLVITGDSSGTSTLNFVNANGSGAQTLEGIQVVQVDGNSGGTFTQGNRVVAGAYDYTLRQGNISGSDDGGWYLTSYVTPDDPVDPVDPVNPVEPIRMVRPEAASYAANLWASRNLFNLSLRDHSVKSMWMRHEGGRNRSSLADGQNKTTANRYVMQLGGDVVTWSSDVLGKSALGIMGGYASQQSNSHNSLTGYGSKGSVKGYSAGVYGMWRQHATDTSGLYLYNWLQYGRFNNEVKGKDLAAESYKSQGLSASLETGYSWRIASRLSVAGMESGIWLQPKAQIIWSGVKADTHTEQNGTHIVGTGNNNVQTTLGARLFMSGKSVLDKDTDREFQPFIETNWIHNTARTGTLMNDVDTHITGARNAGELKVGVEGQLSNRLGVRATVAQQAGGAGYRDTEASLGISYRF